MIRPLVFGLWPLIMNWFFELTPGKKSKDKTKTKGHKLLVSAFHQINETLKVVFGIVRAGCRFGMVLNRNDR
jgi:hypothetical protein